LEFLDRARRAGGRSWKAAMAGMSSSQVANENAVRTSGANGMALYTGD
jgi:hypothetical protein